MMCSLSRTIGVMEVFYLTLVRHGETAENKLKILQGHRDTALSEKGKLQARLLAERLKNEHFTHFFTSDLQRARETCKIIMESNCSSAKQIVEDKRLRERKLGALEGQPFDAWRKSNEKQEQTTGMESKQQLHDHAVSFFQHLCRQMRTSYAEAKQTASAVRELASPKAKPSSVSKSSATRGNSKKRKHVGSVSSLSDSEGLSPVPTDEKPNVAFFADVNTPPTDEWRLSYSSSSSSSGCSSTLTVCELEADIGESSEAMKTGNANVIPNAEVTAAPGLYDFWSCPNVSLPPPSGRSITRVSSVGSGRGGSFEESSLDCLPRTVFASVLVVSHGGLIAELIGHFYEELCCSLPGGRTAAQQITPNAGLSRFSITLLPAVDDEEFDDPEAWIQSRIECLTLHDKDHLANDVEAAPLVVKKAF